MTNQGYIWLWRKLLDSPVTQTSNANLFKVWVWCLLQADHQETRFLWNGKEVTLKPGEFITGRESASKVLYMKPKTWYNQMRLLSKMGNLDIKTNNRFTLVHVVKWAEYQHPSVKMDSKQTTDGQQMDTDNNDKIKDKIRFVDFRPPSYPQVIHMLEEKGYRGDKQSLTEKFIAHYESVGWRVGKNPMKSWQAALAGWIVREREKSVFLKQNPLPRRNKADDLHDETWYKQQISEGHKPAEFHAQISESGKKFYRFIEKPPMMQGTIIEELGKPLPKEEKK
jgi:hypothetical protein